MGKSQHLAKQQESRVLLSVPSRTILISLDAPERLGIQPDFYAFGFQGKAFVNADCKLTGRGAAGGALKMLPEEQKLVQITSIAHQCV